MNNHTLLQTFAKGTPKTTKRLGEENAVIYTRVSTKEQADTNKSLDTQKKYCIDYAEKNNLNILGFFGGTYESAKTDERNEFNRMIKYVKNHGKKISYILVYSLDRFSRTGDNAIYISSQLKKQGISIIAVTQPIDVSTVSGVLQQNIQFIFSKYDNDLRREKCVAGMKEKLLRGEWLGLPPIGYSYASAFRAKEQVIIINDDGRLIKKAFQWKVQEGISNVEIAERLCRMGLKITHKRLSDTFRNPFYCGYVSHNLLEGQVVKGKHPALISERLFLEVNEMISKNPHGYKCKEDDNLFMKGFIKCALCDTPYTGYVRKKKLKNGKELSFYYYKCNTKGCKCNRSSKQVHEDFKNILSGFQIRPEFIPYIKENLEKTYVAVTEDDAETQKVIKAKITELKERYDKLEERFGFGEIERDLFEKLSAKLKAEMTEKEKELEKLRINLSNPSEQIEKVVVTASRLADLWLKGDAEEKKTLQNILFPEGLIYDRKNDQYRTQNVNVVIELIRTLSVGYDPKKEGQTTFYSHLSPSVAQSLQKSNFLISDCQACQAFMKTGNGQGIINNLNKTGSDIV